jgi:hypothetical protein
MNQNPPLGASLVFLEGLIVRPAFKFAGEAWRFLRFYKVIKPRLGIDLFRIEAGCRD